MHKFNYVNLTKLDIVRILSDKEDHKMISHLVAGTS
jgi:hypothetical protein